MNSIKEIDDSTKEGRYLLMAIAALTSSREISIERRIFAGTQLEPDTVLQLLSETVERVYKDRPLVEHIPPIMGTGLRAWDERNKVMHYDFQFIASGDAGNNWIVFVSDKRPLDSTPHPLNDPFFDQQLKIMRPIGKEDANGKQIFEGDAIVSDHCVRPLIIGYNTQAASFCGSDDGDFSYMGKLHFFEDGIMMSEGWQVAGNIYEDPHLNPIREEGGVNG